MKEITRETPIEELIDSFPLAIPLLSQYGIRCILCGEPTWGTIATAAKEKFIEETELDNILLKLNEKYSDYLAGKGINND